MTTATLQCPRNGIPGGEAHSGLVQVDSPKVFVPQALDSLNSLTLQTDDAVGYAA